MSPKELLSGSQGQRLGRGKDKRNKWSQGRKSLQPDKLGSEVCCQISKLGTLLCFGFLKGKMGQRSLPQGLVVMNKRRTRAKWPGTQGSLQILTMDSKKQG